MPDGEKTAIYKTLLPEWLFANYNVDRETLSVDGQKVVYFRCPRGSRAMEASVRRRATDIDPMLYLSMADTFNNQLLVLLVVVNDLDTPRFNVDVDEHGNPTHLGTASRNIPAELAAMKAGLAPGQIYRGMRTFKKSVPLFEEFVRNLGHDMFLIEPLAYHNAIVFERYGFNYMRGYREMVRIHEEFQPGSELYRKLSPDKPFRQLDAYKTVRGRSWAIHDGILGHAFTGFQMYKRIGIHAGITHSPMPSGELRPFISQESVRSALDALVHVSTARLPNPLERLLLVDEFLVNPDFPSIPNGRRFALNSIVASIITEEYHHLRTVFDMNPPEDNISVETALAEVAADLQSGSLELAGWGLLYFRYVRFELGLSIDTLSEAIPADSRTLRRYQQRAVHTLTERFIQKEWVARRQQRKRRLLNELPSSVAIKLFGRGDALREARQALNEHARRHILVTGAPGIGKSAFVQEALREQIEGEALDQLVWIHEPSSPEFVRRHLIERLLPENAGITLCEYLLIYRVGVVLDGAEGLLDDRATLEGLLRELSAALVFLTSRIFLPLHNVTKHIVLGELDEADSISLARTVTGSRFAEKNALAVYKMVGGNPLAVKLVAQDPAPVSRVPNELYAQAHSELDHDLRRTWYVFALLPPGGVDPSKFCKLWPAHFTQEQIVALAHRNLVDIVSQDPPLYFLTSSSRRYVEQLYTSSQDTRAAISELIHELNLDSIPDALDACEHILLCGWLDDVGGSQLHWINLFWRQGVRQGHYANWCSILEAYFRRTQLEDVNLLTAYGICLRRLAQWSDAGRVFQRAIWLGGQAGLFLEQGKALLELSVLYRYQGHYEHVDHLCTQVESILQRYQDGDLADALKMEQAQRTIDIGDARKALHMLAAIQQPSPQQRILQSEAYLVSGEWKLCLDLAQQALEMSENAMGFDARAYSLIGRCFAQQEDLLAAGRNLGLAVTILEREGDPFVLARARTNLAAILIRGGDYDEAHVLLGQAKNMQKLLGDQLGLAATLHNLRLLEIARLDSQ